MSNVVVLNQNARALLSVIRNTDADDETCLSLLRQFGEIEFVKGKTAGVQEARKVIADVHIAAREIAETPAKAGNDDGGDAA